MSKYNYLVVANNKELTDAFKVRETVFIHEQNVPVEIEMDEYDKTATHFIVYDEHLPIAAARIRPYGNNHTAKVERVAVLENYRKTGIGRELMEFVEQEAIKAGFTLCRLNSQRHAENFYAKLGYHTISESFYEADIEHVTMEKKL